ncbi:nucleosome assembly protein 1-like 1-A [Ctenocephalides felis]|uniref:nucleosome assembly protein 1-like 1-A n=1 Tax=Ctenocephalides felis TaxID=7515 RepID=UPI000E6E2430|nr:nucleosome assembly protein 1-like 1-A [Ctenocephalides felis]
MSDNVPKKDVTEQGDQFDFEEFGRYVPLCVRRRNILTQMISDFPEPMKERVKALKELQFENTQLEAEFYKEVFSLECKYQKLYTKLYEKRSEIIHGKREPTPSESSFDIPEPNIEPQLKDKLYEIAKHKMSINTSFTNDTKGIPEFWFQIFRNVYMLSELIEKHDEPVLKTLLDVKVDYFNEPMGFTLHFIFGPNKYFSNKVLTKEYTMTCVPSRENPFNFDGPEITSCKGCEINWYPEKPNKTPKGERR